MGLRDELRSALDAQLQVARTRECNHATSAARAHGDSTAPTYGNVTIKRLTGDLAKAIRKACRARGDSEAQCVALIEECAALPATQQLDLLEHFRGEANRAACRIGDAATPLDSCQ